MIWVQDADPFSLGAGGCPPRVAVPPTRTSKDSFQISLDIGLLFLSSLTLLSTSLPKRLLAWFSAVPNNHRGTSTTAPPSSMVKVTESWKFHCRSLVLLHGQCHQQPVVFCLFYPDKYNFSTIHIIKEKSPGSDLWKTLPPKHMKLAQIWEWIIASSKLRWGWEKSRTPDLQAPELHEFRSRSESTLWGSDSVCLIWNAGVFQPQSFEVVMIQI